jgi:hypothetical protein
MRTPFVIAAPVVLLVLAGCGQEPVVTAPATGPIATDEAQVRDEVARHPELVEDGLHEASDQTALDGGGADGARVAGAIRPLFFWRTIRDVDRRFEFAFADTDSTGRPTVAVLTVHKHLAGSFNILAADTTREDDPFAGHVIHKPLRDHWVRRILLVRVPLDPSDRTVWRIAGSSAVQVTSRQAETRITSLRIQSEGLDTNLTEPLALFRLRRILRFDQHADITLTATTLRSDDVVVLYARHRRLRFHNQGDGTHTATWQAPWARGVHHFGVNALSHGTLFDDQAPYDSQAWILPYVVRPTELAELAP